MGLSMAMQPLVNTLYGEKNTKVTRLLLRRACFNLLISGAVISIGLIVFAKYVVIAFGLSTDVLLSQSIFAVRLAGGTLFVTSILVFFFITYYLLNKNLFAFVITLLKDFAFPVGLSVLFVLIFRTPFALWMGIALAPALTLVVCTIIAIARYGIKLFPYLIPRDRDHRIHVYAFDITPQNAASMSETAGTLLAESGYSKRLQTLVGICLEDMLQLISAKNFHLLKKNKRLLADVTLLLEDNGCKLVIRDTGKLFDIADTDNSVDSLRRYIVANVLTETETNSYLVTTGYNRNELFFKESEAAL